MFNRISTAAGLSIVVSIGLLASFPSGCGKKGKSSQEPADEPDPATQAPSEGTTSSSSVEVRPTSLYFDKKSDLPTCGGALIGALSYVKDESRFYHCSSDQWSDVSVTGPKGDTGSAGAKGDKGDSGSSGSGGFSVYDANGTRLGVLTYNDWPTIGIQFSNNGLARFSSSGTYVSGFCTTDTCADPSALNFAQTISSCLYLTADCTGTCYTHKKPLKHSLFRAGSSWLTAAGTESSISIDVKSSFRVDLGTCLTSGGPTQYTTTGHPVTTSFSFPTGITYPLTGPLYFAP